MREIMNNFPETTANYSILLHTKPALTLLSLREKSRVWYASMLAKNVDCTYPHMIKILNDFQGHGLIMTEKKGRTKLVKLSERGEDLARSLNSLVVQLDKL